MLVVGDVGVTHFKSSSSLAPEDLVRAIQVIMYMRMNFIPISQGGQPAQ